MERSSETIAGRGGLVATSLVGVVALGVGITLLADPIFAIPRAWALLVALALATGATVVALARKGRLLEPLGIVAGVTAFAFVVRPLQLLLASDQLAYMRYRGASTDTAASLLDLRTQEITLYVQTRLTAPLQSSIASALLACLLFFVFVLIGYRADLGRRAGSVGRHIDDLNVLGAVCGLAVIGLLSQALVMLKLGGPTGIIGQFGTQATLRVGFPYFIGLACLPVALLVWACWHPPWMRPERLAFYALGLESAAFYAATGSRTLLFMPIVLLVLARHYLHRRWSTRELLGAILVAIVLATSYVAVREATYSGSFGEAVRSAPQNATGAGGVLNDDSAFDYLFMAIQQFPDVTSFQHGGAITRALHSYVPSAIDPSKPDGGDIWFRKLIWGERFQAGRPYTVVGEFYADFGWAGIVSGSLLLGLALRWLTGLVRDPQASAGRAYRVALFSILAFVLLTLLTGTYTIALGFVLQLLLPFFLGVHLLGRTRKLQLPDRSAGAQ